MRAWDAVGAVGRAHLSQGPAMDMWSVVHLPCTLMSTLAPSRSAAALGGKGSPNPGGEVGAQIPLPKERREVLTELKQSLIGASFIRVATSTCLRSLSMAFQPCHPDLAV